MSTAERYATVAQLQDRLTSRTSATSAVTLALADASEAVESYCGRVFTLDTVATARVYLPQSRDLVLTDDIGETASLAVATGLDGISWAAMSATDWWTYPVNALAKNRPITQIASFNGFPMWIRPTVQVTAKWGWPAVPASVTEATLLMASRLYERRSSPSGVAGFGDAGVVRIGAQDVDVARMLNNFVRTAL